MGQPTRRLHGKRNLAGLGIGILLAVVTLAATGVSLYSQQSGSLAALGVNIEDLVGVRLKNLFGAQVMPAPEPIKDIAPDEELRLKSLISQRPPASTGVIGVRSKAG